MNKFKYQIIKAIEIGQRDLDKLGSEGWELCAVIKHNTYTRLIFKRLIDEHYVGRINHSKRLWALIIFALWQERYL